MTKPESVMLSELGEDSLGYYRKDFDLRAVSSETNLRMFADR